MTTVAVVYHSGTGKTAMLATSVLAGIAEAGGTAIDLRIQGSQIGEGRFADDAFLARIDAADAVILGSPTYMGMVSGQFKAFADATAGRWFGRAWKDKLAAGFTTSGSPSGDKQGTLVYLATLAAQHGMVWVTQEAINGTYLGQSVDQALNRLGAHLGVMSQVAPTPEGAPTPGDLATAKALGARVTSLASKLR